MRPRRHRAGRRGAIHPRRVALTLRLSGRVPTLAYDLWPATDEARDAKAAAIAGGVPGAAVTLLGRDLPVPPEAMPPADGTPPAVDPFAAYPVAVANEFFSDGRAAEIRVEGSPEFETLCDSVVGG